MTNERRITIDGSPVVMDVKNTHIPKNLLSEDLIGIALALYGAEQQEDSEESSWGAAGRLESVEHGGLKKVANS